MKNYSKRLVLAVTMLALTTLYMLPSAALAQVKFDDWFENHALRIDYVLAGNSTSQQFFLDELRMEEYWSGSPGSIIDELSYGTHRVEVRDKATKSLLYAHGFCTLFQEWQTVHEATILSKAFEQVTRVPFPKKDVTIAFLSRSKETGKFESLNTFDVSPSSIFINRTPSAKISVSPIVNNGDHRQKLDIAFIAEGYTASQMEKFRMDVTKLADYLFSQEPFSALKGSINIWAIESPSEAMGPTNPGTGKWNRTAAGSSFYTFGIDRYLTSTKHKRIMDIASNAPTDVVYVLVNTAEYGGGGIYNHYNVATSNHRLTNQVFIHELGHGLAGLADEYYTSDVAYENFYPLHVEPWEPNITTRVNFDSKWADMVSKATPTPTPASENYASTVGVFEGGGYMAKGVFRPYIDCRMKSNEAKGFCPVCQKAIERVVLTYTK